jgi:hypothetical protein
MVGRSPDAVTVALVPGSTNTTDQRPARAAYASSPRGGAEPPSGNVSMSVTATLVGGGPDVWETVAGVEPRWPGTSLVFENIAYKVKATMMTKSIGKAKLKIDPPRV